jgi:hypothetical protein
MAEICTPPIVTYDDEGNPSYTFNEHHTWRDVARWIAKTHSDLEDIIFILNEFNNAKPPFVNNVDDFIGCFDE